LLSFTWTDDEGNRKLAGCELAQIGMLYVPKYALSDKQINALIAGMSDEI
jgi:hypothetical protein